MIRINTYIGCSALIYGESQKVLIVQRSNLKKKYPGLWETIGGALETYETPEECIRREIREEINCNVEELKLFNVYIVTDIDRYVLIVYTGKIIDNIECNAEIEQIRWIDETEISNFDFYGNEREKLKDYFASKG